MIDKNIEFDTFNIAEVDDFDSEFNEIVLSRFKENFSYFSFSEGQKKRIDLAVLFAFINFALFKNKKCNTNLLVFDEIDTGISGEAARKVSLVMKEHSSKHKVITITHLPQIAGKADSHFFVYKSTEAEQTQTGIRKLSKNETSRFGEGGPHASLKN